MEDSFDKTRAKETHDSIIREAERIRDGLSADVINYYYDRYPSSEYEEKTYQEGIRRYLKIAQRNIDDLLDRL